MEGDGNTWNSKVLYFGDWVDDYVTNMMEDNEKKTLWGGHRGEIGGEIFISILESLRSV